MSGSNSDDAETRIGLSKERPQYWSTPQAPTLAIHTPSQPTSAVPRETRGAGKFVAGALALVVGAAGGGYLLASRNGSSNSPGIASGATTAATAGPTNAPSSAATDSSRPSTAQSASTSTGPVGTPSSQVPTSAAAMPAPTTTAPFPAGTDAFCGSDEYGKAYTYTPIRVAGVRVNLTQPSCTFVVRLSDDVRSKVAASPELTTFEASAVSPRDEQLKTAACTRKSHLSTCAVHPSRDGTVLYITDTPS